MTWLKKPASKIHYIRRKPPPGEHASGIPAERQSQFSAWKWRISGGGISVALAARHKGFSRR
jgi:hypothetical protein